MDSLRIVLIIVASLVIVALLIHGFWINKKERSSLFDVDSQVTNKESEQKLSWQTRDDGFIDGVGEVKVSMPKIEVGDEPLSTESENNHLMIEHSIESEPYKPIQQDFFSDNLSEPKEAIDEQIILPNNSKIEEDVEEKTEEQLVIEEQENEQTLSDVIILHICGINGEALRGDLLLNSIIQSGFQFGEMSIYHRHLDPAGNGPVLFSLANMMKPGHLNPETMHEDSILGVSIFMMLLSYGNTQQNFKLMLQTAQRIADDVNGVVYDEERHMLTPQKIDSYKERIKQLEENRKNLS